MPDHNHAQEFNEAKTQAEGRWQEALTDVYTVFGKAIDDIDREHAARMQAARSAFDAVKANPEHPSHAEARVAFDAIRGTTPDYTEARTELDRAVRAADDAYHAEVQKIAAEHGVTTL